MPTMSHSDDEDPPSLESLTQNLTQKRCSTTYLNDQETRCCCGRGDCSFTRRSQAMLAELEKDVQTAATLGQALLRRHEDSMAEAEREREKMSQSIVSLENQISELEIANARTCVENKDLLGTLEGVNVDMCLSESRVRELQEELDVVHEELTRISATAARTTVLEAQLAVLESEQEELRNTVTTTKTEERAAVARWKKAERTLNELEQQVERIEMENALEKARSQNLLERLEQKRVVNPTTGHSSLTALQDRTQLSRFMKEILAENGHLQIGITELRDMLMASQEEVNRLREQLHEIGAQGIGRDRSPLSQELGRSPSAMQTIVHHHHYHAPPSKEKGISKPVARRPKKRRGLVGGEHFLPLEHTGSSPPTAFSKRLSTDSHATSGGAASSALTSPVSTFRESSIFDNTFAGPESSRPSSADSNYQKSKRSSTSSSKYARRSDSSFGIPPFSILHTTEEVPSDHDFSRPSSPIVPATKLRRAASHESMLSVIDLNLAATSFPVSPALSSTHSTVSNSATKRMPAFAASVTPNHAQASVTHGMAIRSPSSGSTSSAYCRLLGLQESAAGSSPPAQRSMLSRKTSGGLGAGWFWRWGAGASPGAGSALETAKNVAAKDEVRRNGGGSRSGSSSEAGSKPGGSVSTGGRAVTSMPSVLTGYVDEGLLKESLGEVQAMLGSF